MVKVTVTENGKMEQKTFTRKVSFDILFRIFDTYRDRAGVEMSPAERMYFTLTYNH